MAEKRQNARADQKSETPETQRRQPGETPQYGGTEKAARGPCTESGKGCD